MLSGDPDVSLVSTHHVTPGVAEPLRGGTHRSKNAQYGVQLAQMDVSAGRHHRTQFVGNQPSALVLCENIFYWNDQVTQLGSAHERASDASVFAHHADALEPYGAVASDTQQRAISIEEKPAQPKSN